MKRYYDAVLDRWAISKGRKPLILRGARQVGKTYLVRAFAERHFLGKFVWIDFEKHPQFQNLFDRDLDPKRIVNELEIRLGVMIVDQETLVFFDEIQLCPRAITALRYFYEEMPHLHVIAAGSLLEFALKDISIPVGRVRYLEIEPLTFLEFLEALGKEKMAQLVAAAPQVLSEGLHQTIMDHLKTYFFVGGMPAAVLAFSRSGLLREAFEVHVELVKAYRQDYLKYAPKVNGRCLDQVLTSLARSGVRPVKYSSLSQEFSGPTIKNAVFALEKARLIRCIESVKLPGIPLGMSVNSACFKPLIVDIGLSAHLCGGAAVLEYEKGNVMDMFRGSLAEQFVGQALCSTQQQEDGVYFWERQAKNSTAEVDFLCVLEGKIVPIEVKNKAIGRLRSLEVYLKEVPQTSVAFVFSEKPYLGVTENRVKFYPLYAIYSLTRPGA